jgi:tetratricopeptide (TPR) repeat protein
MKNSNRVRCSPLWKARCILWMAVAGMMFACLPLHAQTLTKDDLRKQIAIYETASQQAGTAGIPVVQVGRIWSRLGTLYQDAGLYAKADDAFEHAMHLLQTPPVDRQALATNIDNLGTLYVEMGNVQEGEHAELKALKMREELGLKLELARSWYHLATAYTREHNRRQARAFAQRAADAFFSDPGATPEGKVGSLFVLAFSLCQFHQYPDAIAKLQNALQLIRANYKPDQLPNGMGEFLLGYAEAKNGDRAAAADWMRQGTEIIANQLGERHPASLSVMVVYERFLRQTHQRDAAHLIEQRLRRVRSEISSDPGFSERVQTVDVTALF